MSCLRDISASVTGELAPVARPYTVNFRAYRRVGSTCLSLQIRGKRTFGACHPDGQAYNKCRSGQALHWG